MLDGRSLLTYHKAVLWSCLFMIRRFHTSFFLFLIITHLSSVATLFAGEEPYRIGRNDVLDITVWQSPDLTKTVSVTSDGTIAYPILGNVPAAGLTPQDLEKTIAEKLAQGYVKDPQVNIAIKEYNSKQILVFGEVEKPGLYKLKGKIPLLELLFLVGGTKPDAKRMTVIRAPHPLGEDALPTALLPTSEDVASEATNAQAIELDLIALLSKGDLSQNIMILPGDTIYVSSGTGQRFYVLGQVNQPGPYEWVQTISALEAIKLAGGPTERGALNRIQIRQNRGGQQTLVKLNIVDIMKGKRKDEAIIEAGDVIIVPESWI